MHRKNYNRPNTTKRNRPKSTLTVEPSSMFKSKELERVCTVGNKKQKRFEILECCLVAAAFLPLAIHCGEQPFLRHEQSVSECRRGEVRRECLGQESFPGGTNGPEPQKPETNEKGKVGRKKRRNGEKEE